MDASHSTVKNCDFALGIRFSIQDNGRLLIEVSPDPRPAPSACEEQRCGETEEEFTERKDIRSYHDRMAREAGEEFMKNTAVAWLKLVAPQLLVSG